MTDKTIADVEKARMVTVSLLISADASDEERQEVAQAGAAAFAAFAIAGPPPGNRLMARIGGVPVIISFDNPADVAEPEALAALH